MIGNLFRRLVAGGGAAEPKVTAREEYNGFELLAIPVKDARGWRVAGSVVKATDGDERRHDFVRADVYPAQEDASTVSLRKAKQLVDEQGDRLFD